MKFSFYIYAFCFFIITTTCHARANSASAIVVWAEQDKNEQYNIYITLKRQGAWSEKFSVSKSNQPETHPVIIADADENIWVVWSRMTGMNGTIFSRFYSSSDLQWHEIQPIPSNTTSDLAPTLGIDNAGVVWLAYSGSGSQADDIYLARWNGSRWSKPFQLNKPENTPDILPHFILDEENNLAVVWLDIKDGNYVLTKSTRRGDSWTDEKNVSVTKRGQLQEKRVQQARNRTLLIPLPADRQAAAWVSDGKQRVAIRLNEK